MFKHVKTLSFILILFIFSLLLAVHLDNNKISLPSFISNCLSSIEALFSRTGDVISAEIVEEETPNKQSEQAVPPEELSKSSKHMQLPNELGAYSVACTDKINAPRAKTIFTWVDEQGVRNVSDTPRKIDNATEFKILKHIQPQKVSIQYSGDSNLKNIHYKISQRIVSAKAFFAKVTPEHLIVPVQINLSLVSDMQAYSRLSHSASVKNAQGFYQAGKNKAIVLAQNDVQTINTAVHEAIHAINRHWFGRMARWLNEGIAENAELDWQQDALNSEWQKHLHKQTLGLKQVFESTENDWSNLATRPHLYNTSRAFVAFLMDKHRSTLIRLLLQESENGCQTINTADIERIYGASVINIQRDFDKWRRIKA
uniref:hypothetical protein n=1 Tax=Ningiella ruwaisensis TaxID=2364274 RepID=UPI00109F3803|nr:hypothetical protein [Ningiella ruwaisensis]